YLDSLGPAEASEWLACIQEYWHAAPENDGFVFTLKAAEYARMFKSKGRTLVGMCAGDGNHGAACPQRAVYRIKSSNCRSCDGQCSGHDGLCVEHFQLALDGRMTHRATGDPIVVTAYA
ncbi:hypothetical protein ADL26_17015, partial [Thermoactinomyces vulgaris]